VADGPAVCGRELDRLYTDVLLHRSFMGPVTAVARVERVSYEEPDGEDSRRRQTVGARIRLQEQLSVTVNVIHQERVGQREPIDRDGRRRDLDQRFP